MEGLIVNANNSVQGPNNNNNMAGVHSQHPQYALGGEDTVRVSRCGCVPAFLYEDVQHPDKVQGGGSPAGLAAPSWARKIPLFGPLWCVSGAQGTTKVRRRDNAVYRSNSFKYERKSPNFGIKLKTLDPPPPDPVKQKAVAASQAPPVQDLRINLNYSDPQDAELLQGAFNQAFQGDTEVEDRVPLTKVCLGGDIYYCKPYQPFHTQLRYNFSDLQESGVDNESEYELMPSSHRNNNGGTSHCGGACSGGGGGAPCGPQCARLAASCGPKRGAVSKVSTIQEFNQVVSAGSNKDMLHSKLGSHHLKSHFISANGKKSDYNPTYENLSFHKVTINVPDHLQHAHHDQDRRNVHRNLPVRKSKVPLKYQGIKRIKSKAKLEDVASSKTLQQQQQLHDAKNGYSQKEVWNWLHLDEDNRVMSVANHSTTCSVRGEGGVRHFESADYDGDLCCDNEDAGEEGRAGVSVQFSPAEFLSATTRLAHLDLEGFERFVGNTFDRAIAGAKAGRTKSSDLLLDNDAVKGNEVDENDILDECVDTDTYVWKDTCRSRQTCISCLKSGVSSCSSALSSLESGGSRETGTSRDTSGSGLSRETTDSSSGADMTHDSDSGHPSSGPGNSHNSSGSSQHYLKMTAGGRVSRMSKFPAYASVVKPVPGSAGSTACGGGLPFNTKPYQTLEVNLEDACCLPGGIRIDKRLGLELVDPSIQLHQQEWYHGNVSRQEAEVALRLASPGSYLVRNSESTSKDYSLSLKSTHGFMHMRIQQTPDGQYILGQFSRPFPTIPHMINYYTINKLPIRGAEHVSLKRPLCEQLL